jgi:LysR family nod box-dependent transcriptional activator
MLTERSLTAAARSVNLSQPAMSAALARLRDYFDDDIFALRGRRLSPTALGKSLAAPTRDMLLRIKAMLDTRHEFDPASSKRRFRLALSDFMTIVFFHRVIERTRRLAPGVSFELLPFGDEPDELLRRGEIDFLIFPDMFLSDAFPKASLRKAWSAWPVALTRRSRRPWTFRNTCPWATWRRNSASRESPPSRSGCCFNMV